MWKYPRLQLLQIVFPIRSALAGMAKFGSRARLMAIFGKEKCKYAWHNRELE